MTKKAMVAWVVATAISATAQTVRIKGRVIDEAELRDQYAKVFGVWVYYRNGLSRPEQVGAVRMTVEVLSIIDSHTALVNVDKIEYHSEKPDGAQSPGSRIGRQFTIAETDAQLTAPIQVGDHYALRLRQKTTDMPMAIRWDIWVHDSNTFIEMKRRDGSKVKLRVLYDITMKYEDFVSFLQRGRLFPELVNP